MIAAWAAAPLAYLIAGLFLARRAFGWMRARSIDHYMSSRYQPDVDGALESWRDVDRIPAMMVAALVVLAWPVAAVLAVAGWAFARFLDGTPRISQTEHKAQIEARDQRIAELEAEAGIK